MICPQIEWHSCRIIRRRQEGSGICLWHSLLSPKLRLYCLSPLATRGMWKPMGGGGASAIGIDYGQRGRRGICRVSCSRKCGSECRNPVYHRYWHIYQLRRALCRSDLYGISCASGRGGDSQIQRAGEALQYLRRLSRAYPIGFQFAGRGIRDNMD